ncbi:MAG: sensor histidine kinase [Pyrinomonadaceae bacterium]|nr:sensor histidine kinase [Pyrinomonadaceae bacterium]
MGIRGRLLLLAIGIAVPLALVGVADLRGMWRTSRQQLDESVKQQAELAAVAFERWVDAQRQPLTTLAAMVEAQGPATPQAFEENLRFIVSTRPHWIDLRVVDVYGNSLTAQPAGVEPPPPALVEHLITESQQRNDWVVVTDRTGSEERPVFAIAAPVRGGGAVIARVDGAVVSELFRDIEFPERGVIAVFDTENRLLYRRPTTRAEGDPAVDSSPLFAAFGERRVAVVEVESPYDGIRRVYGLARAGATGGIVVVGVPSAILYEPARQQLMRHLIFSLLALVCAVIAALFIERSIVRPIERLRQSAQALGAGYLETRAPVKGSREIVELGAAFNRMAAQIAEREERLTELDRLKSEFVSSVSHELRTPLTTIKTLTRVLERGGQTEEERREYLETIAVECDRQIDLVLNLLDLSRIESGAYKVSRTRVNPAEVVVNCVVIERHAAEAREQTLEAELPAELPAVRADGGALRRVLCGLVENAIKYTPDGGRIIIKAAPAGDDEVAISVADTGCGILAEDLPHVFEKFYRGRPGNACAYDSPAGTSSAHTEAPGIGLGLYIARSIIEQLGGRITVESPGGRGTVFTLFLPVWNEERSAGLSNGNETSQEERDVEAFTRG